MNALVFGGSGFLGSHTADVLSENRYDVTIFDTKKSPYIKPDQHMIVGSILDKNAVEKAVKNADVVYNFAALADLDESHNKPLETIETNILGNTIILDSCLKNKVNRYVFASTIYIYSDAGSFYRISKFACELIIQNYWKEYELPYTILRYGSLYGPRCQKNNFIYGILRQALTEKKVSRIGDGEEIREYIHVRDASELSVVILSDKYKNQSVNITGNQSMKIKELFVMISEMLEGNIDIEYLPGDSVSHHYRMTPYKFDQSPEIGKKLVSNYYHDFGQGILESLDMIRKECNASDTI